MIEDSSALTRTAASQAVEQLGWRYLLGTLCTSVAAGSLDQALRWSALAVQACGERADGHLRLDVRPDRLELSLQHRASGVTTAADVELAQVITGVLQTAGASTGGQVGSAQQPRPVQMLEIAIDALDIPAVRPFWKAVLALVDDPSDDGPQAALVDPAGQLPAVWFQQMDAERPQRNRIHLDITVSHDEAPARLAAALAAGGRLVSDSAARAFWVLADAEGNEICICTWQDRDPLGD